MPEIQEVGDVMLMHTDSGQQTKKNTLNARVSLLLGTVFYFFNTMLPLS